MSSRRNILNLKAIQSYFTNHPLTVRVLDWSKTHSLPGFFGVAIADILIFVFNEIRRFDLSTRANSIAFSFFLSLFPSLILLLTLLPFFQEVFELFVPLGGDFEGFLYAQIKEVMPGKSGDQLFQLAKNLTSKRNIGLLSFGVVLAIYFSSNGMMALMKSFEKSHVKIFKRRGTVRKRMLSIILTAVLGFMLIVSVVFIILGNTIVSWIDNWIPLDGFATFGFGFIRWLTTISLYYFGISFIYRYGAPAIKRFDWFSPGTTLATTLSLLSSLIFSFYIDNFGRYESYDRFYGSITAFIILMLWMQLNAMVILIGYELNASIAVNRDLKEQTEEENALAAVSATNEGEALEETDVSSAEENNVQEA